MRGMTTTMMIAALLIPAAAAQTGDPDLAQEIERLKEGQEEIRSDLADIKRMLSRPARPAGPDVEGMELDLGDAPVRGDADAPLTLVEFSEYQCPFCARHVQQTLPALEERFIEEGTLRLAWVDLPLAMHRSAEGAAEAAHCAGRQGQYWEMHERLFANQRSLEPFTPHAEAIGLDVAEFEACMEGDLTGPIVAQGKALAAKVGASGTPSFVLARTDPDDPSKVVGIEFIRGAKPFAAFEQAVKNALAEE